LNARIDETENNSTTKNISDLYRDISDFKKGYQPTTNILKDEKGNLVTDIHSILARWGNYFAQLLNVHGFNDVRQMEIHTAEPLVLEPNAFEFEMATDKLKTHITRKLGHSHCGRNLGCGCLRIG
jgi:hypothetical protein